MTTQDEHYRASIEVAAPPARCFAAIATGMDRWWTATTEGALHAVGDRIMARFPPNFGHWVFEARRLEPDTLIEMECVEARHQVAGQPEAIDQEWLGTTLVWRFEPLASGTRITLTHRGLTPRLHCWDICQTGWDHFFGSSLKRHLDGEPATPHEAG